jgi:osmoprotectant transport system permease protein
MIRRKLRIDLMLTFYFIALLIWVFGFENFKGTLASLLGSGIGLVSRTSLPVLTWQHIQLVALASSAAILVSLLLGMIVHLTRNEEAESLVMKLGSILETIPSAAVIALSIPLFGYGNGPVLMALWVYAILPILRNTIVGLQSINPSIQDAATGIGMSPLQRLLKIEMPLARPMILAGIKTALVINISLATIGATVGAGGLGVPIIAGIRSYDPLLVLQGSIAVILMALLTERALR